MRTAVRQHPPRPKVHLRHGVEGPVEAVGDVDRHHGPAQLLKGFGI